jgi:quercetin dioxygenase-like cupin family protein
MAGVTVFQVTTGRLTFRWPDHDETYVAGDAYYAPPGHLPLLAAGTAIVEFSSTADLEATMAVVQSNLTDSAAPA